MIRSHSLCYIRYMFFIRATNMQFQHVIWIVLCILGHNSHNSDHVAINIYAKIQTLKSHFKSESQQISKKIPFFTEMFSDNVRAPYLAGKASHDLVLACLHRSSPHCSLPAGTFICLRNHAHFPPLSCCFTFNRFFQHWLAESTFSALCLLFFFLIYEM